SFLGKRSTSRHRQRAISPPGQTHARLSPPTWIPARNPNLVIVAALRSAQAGKKTILWPRNGSTKRANSKMNKNGNLAFVQFRNPKFALGNGRVQRTAQRAFMISDLVSTGDVVQLAHRKRVLIDGFKLVSRHYQDARRVLAQIADPVGRQRGRGRAWLWRLKPEHRV